MSNDFRSLGLGILRQYPLGVLVYTASFSQNGGCDKATDALSSVLCCSGYLLFFFRCVVGNDGFSNHLCEFASCKTGWSVFHRQIVASLIRSIGTCVLRVVTLCCC